MPKLEKASMTYTVSFNCSFGGYECGEEDRYSEDYHGDNIDELAAEVCVGDPDYPMTFKRNDDPNSAVVGMFYGEDSEYPDALMVPTIYF